MSDNKKKLEVTTPPPSPSKRNPPPGTGSHTGARDALYYYMQHAGYDEIVVVHEEKEHVGKLQLEPDLRSKMIEYNNTNHSVSSFFEAVTGSHFNTTNYARRVIIRSSKTKDQILYSDISGFGKPKVMPTTVSLSDEVRVTHQFQVQVNAI